MSTLPNLKFWGSKTPTDEVETTVPELTGTVENSRKFESLVGRLLLAQPGESSTKTWTIRVLSLLLGFPVILTAIVDLGRAIGFWVANKTGNVTLQKYFDGKSWSLIDRVSAGCKAVAVKVDAAYKAHQNPPLEVLNERSAKAMKSAVAQIVGGYNALNGGLLHSNDSFSTNYALNAEAQIEAGQEALVEAVNQYLARNATNTEDFAVQLTAIQAKVREYFKEAAGNDRYVEDKTVRRVGTRNPFIRDIGFNEFLASFDAADQYVALARNETDFGQSLQNGVVRGILTPAQAKEAVEEQACESFTQGMKTGLGSASAAEKGVLDSAVKSGVVTSEEAETIESQNRPSVMELAVAAARDVAKEITPETTAEIVQAKLIDAVEKLVPTKLDPNDRSGFLTEAQAQLSAIKTADEAALKAEQEAQTKAELEAMEAAAAAEAERIAQVKKVEDQTALLRLFKDFLSLIAKKQADLNAQFDARNDLETGRKAVTDVRDQILKSCVKVKGKDRPFLEARQMYETEVNRISNSEETERSVRRSDQIAALRNAGFDETIKSISDLDGLALRLQEKLKAIEVAREGIKSLYKELIALLAQFNRFKKDYKGQLEKATFDKEVAPLADQVLNTQKGLDKAFNKLRLKAGKVVVNIAPEANKDAICAAVQAFIQANQPPVKVQVEEENEMKVEEPKVEAVAEEDMIPNDMTTLSIARERAANAFSKLWGAAKSAGNRYADLRG